MRFMCSSFTCSDALSPNKRSKSSSKVRRAFAFIAHLNVCGTKTLGSGSAAAGPGSGAGAGAGVARSASQILVSDRTALFKTEMREFRLRAGWHERESRGHLRRIRRRRMCLNLDIHIIQFCYCAMPRTAIKPVQLSAAIATDIFVRNIWCASALRVCALVLVNVVL